MFVPCLPPSRFSLASPLLVCERHGYLLLDLPCTAGTCTEMLSWARIDSRLVFAARFGVSFLVSPQGRYVLRGRSGVAPHDGAGLSCCYGHSRCPVWKHTPQEARMVCSCSSFGILWSPTPPTDHVCTGKFESYSRSRLSLSSLWQDMSTTPSFQS